MPDSATVLADPLDPPFLLSVLAQALEQEPARISSVVGVLMDCQMSESVHVPRTASLVWPRAWTPMSPSP
jgi:hypothetical protein